MIVAELIELLKQMPQEATVLIGCYNDLKSIRYHDYGGLLDEKVVHLSSYPTEKIQQKD